MNLTTNVSLFMNASSSNTSIETLLYNDSPASKAAKVLAYAVVLVASIVGNSFVILAMKSDHRGKLRRRFTYLIITSIAVSDLLMAVVSIPERITRVISHDEWLIPGTGGRVLCKLVNFVEKVSITVSAVHVVALAAHRFTAIFQAQRTSKARNCRLAAICIITVWLFSMLFWSPVLYYGGLLAEKNPSRLYCRVRYFYPQWRFSYMAFLVLLLAILLIVLVLYSSIWVKITCTKTLRDDNITVVSEMRRKSTTMVAVIVASFYICFLPYWLGWIVCSYQQIFCSSTFTFISIYVTHASVAVNPVICLIFSRHYRDAFREQFTSYNTPKRRKVTML